MKLQEFVKQSLIEVSKGVKEAQEELEKSGALINPMNLVCNSKNTEYIEMIKPGFAVELKEKGKEDVIFKDADGEECSGYNAKRIGFIIDFDIAVTISSLKTGQGGAEINVAGVANIGGKGKKEAVNNTISKIRFRVPLFLP